jgi:catechol 2,3-dioxygenase-like lactoylglutathione lyase family enzyme
MYRPAFAIYITLDVETAPASTPTQTHKHMKQSIGQLAILVREYDEAIEFYVNVLGFTLVEDSYIPEQNKRWILVAPPGSIETRLLLARATSEEQSVRVGNQTGGRVFLFLFTDDFWRDFHAYKAKGVVFAREPREEAHGTVAVFRDLYGNLWDLLQPKR